MAVTRATHVQVDFGDIHDQNLEQLRKLNLGTFPVRYNAKFYSNILNTPKEFTQVCWRVDGWVGPRPYAHRRNRWKSKEIAEIIRSQWESLEIE